jgi:hypothetical protein
MVGYKKRYFYFGTDITLDFYLCFDSWRKWNTSILQM